MVSTGLGVWLLAVAAAPLPPPLPPPAVRGVVDRDAVILAVWLADLAGKLGGSYVRPAPAGTYILAGMEGVYRAAGTPLPAPLREMLRDDPTQQDIAKAYRLLGRVDAVAGMRGILAAADGLTRATDPYCTLTSPGVGGMAGSEAEFGLGFELEGATGPSWLLYRAELAAGRPEPPTSPAELPWRVRRVLPGGPAAAAGLRPGDEIREVGGEPITSASAAELFRRLVPALPPGIDGLNPFDTPPPLVLTVSRAGEPPRKVRLSREPYRPRAVYGVCPRADGTWDYRLDRAAKIGYVRLGTIEAGAADDFRAAVESIVADGAAGMVLDLRWCPGGYVEETAEIALLLLPRDQVAMRQQLRSVSPVRRTEYKAGAADGRAGLIGLPVIVLVGPETTGGGELIAAALQDNGRARVVGQRTFGKATVGSPVETAVPGLVFRVTQGYSLRPTGKPRHRFPDSKPADEWGVRPDPGCCVPISPDVSAGLRAAADAQAIRPAGERAAGTFDDPWADPQKLVAVRLLKEQLRK